MHAPSLKSATFDPDEIRLIVRRGKERGDIIENGKARPVEKTGAPVAAEHGLRSVWMDVGPEKARHWLDNNFRNRPLKDDVVAAYARDMLNGVWVPTHQGVAFNDRDELIDGQHRLHAIIRSGKTVRMMVTFGLPATIEGAEMTTMDAVDRGRTRSVADQLAIQHGFKNASITAAICMSIAGLCCRERTRRLSVGQTLDIFRAYEGAILWAIERRSKVAGMKAAGVLAAFVFAMWARAEDTEQIGAMYERLIAGDDLKKGSAMAALHAFLTSDEAKLLTRGTDRGVAELTLEAIRLEQEGKRVTRLEMATTGIEHYAALQPERVEKITSMFRLPEAQS